jgi:hypothetical protein
MERVVLREVRRFADQDVSATRRQVASKVFGLDSGSDQTAPFIPPGPAQMTSFHRAVRSLEKKGLLSETQWTNVLEVTARGTQELCALGGGPQRERLDLRDVRQGTRAALRELARPQTTPNAPNRSPLRAGKSPASRWSTPLQARAGAAGRHPRYGPGGPARSS